MNFDEVFNNVNFTIGSLLSIFIWLLGGNDRILSFLLALMISEFFTSLYLSFKGIRYKDKRQRMQSIINKVAILWIVVLGVFIDRTFMIDGQLLSTRNMLISFFIGHEGLTNIENYDIMGIRLPDGIRKFFLSLIKK